MSAIESSGPIEDRLAIRELLEAYCEAVFHKDADAWGAIWADDAVWNLAGHDIAGREAIVGAWKQAMGMFRHVSFFVMPTWIKVDGDTATGRSYTNEFLVDTEGTGRHIVGLYDDEFKKIDGRWRIAVRRYSLMHEFALTEQTPA